MPAIEPPKGKPISEKNERHMKRRAAKAERLAKMEEERKAGVAKAQRAAGPRHKDAETLSDKKTRVASISHKAAIRDGLTHPVRRDAAICGKVGRLARIEPVG